MQFQLKHLWHLQDAVEEISFGAGFWFDEPKDLTQVAKDLEEGISICASKFIAGPRHLKNVLYQASEYWRRGKRLARNPSIDLLMRVLCQSQISKAVELSQVSFAREIAVFGISKQPSSLEGVFDTLVKVGGKGNDKLLEITVQKAKFLKEFHGLPNACNEDQICDLLVEKSALLVFSK